MKNKRLILVFFLFAVLVFSAILAYRYNLHTDWKKISINGKEFKVEAVSDSKKMAKGLGGRDEICDYCGMLFQFSYPDRHEFWMKDMRFSLDIVWILNNRIVYIARNVPKTHSEIITPDYPADRVLELNGGACDKNGIKENDLISF